jgi:hypothetical protein
VCPVPSDGGLAICSAGVCTSVFSNTSSSSPSFSGSLRRQFCPIAPDAVSQRRRSAQALLTLASPSAQVAQSRSCSRL